jgi:[acyl-carrier-protein] S-malonyltransferase
MRVGAMFPGQGSQAVGMGADVAAHSPRARALFDRARIVLGYDLLALQIDGPEEKLRETQYSQPSIFTTNLALYEAVGETLSPVVSAGHSFGELCSLVIAGSLGFDEALRVVDERGQAMQVAAELAGGGMAAVLGLEAGVVRDVVERTRNATGRRVQLANFNSPTQIVVSGDLDAVQAAGEAMLAAGAKRVVPLNVSGAWHSELMQPAIDRFAVAVERANFTLPAFDVVSNVDAQPYRNVSGMLSYELDLVVEFGASGVLGPLMRRMPNSPRVLVVSDYSGVERLQEMVRASSSALSFDYARSARSVQNDTARSARDDTTRSAQGDTA